MGKLLFGLAAGSALTAAAFLLFEAETDKALTDIGDIPSVAPLADDITGTEDRPQDAARDGPEPGQGAQESSASVDTGSPMPELTEDELRNLTPEEFQALVENASPDNQQQYVRIMDEKFRRETVERWSNEPPPTQPITLPPEFSWLSLSEHPEHSHEKLQREAVDPAWSPATEAQIATFLAEHPDITQKYGYPTVNCRTSGCELAFVAYGVNETSLDILLDGRFKSVSEQPWAGQFENSWDNLFTSRTDGDTTTFLWYLNRKPE